MHCLFWRALATFLILFELNFSDEANDYVRHKAFAPGSMIGGDDLPGGSGLNC